MIFSLLKLQTCLQITIKPQYMKFIHLFSICDQRYHSDINIEDILFHYGKLSAFQIRDYKSNVELTKIKGSKKGGLQYC